MSPTSCPNISKPSKPLNPEVKEKHSFNVSLNGTENRSFLGLSWMSFFISTSSLMIFAILPIFLKEVLGASTLKIGLMEGIAIGASFLAKFFSGILSDRWRTRKPFIFWGTLGSFLTRLLFPLALSVPFVFWTRFIDRISKGVRSAPTDALIADLSHENYRGKGFGLRQALYTLGAAFGASVATALMLLSNNDYRLVFWSASVAAFLSLLILIIFVRPSEQEVIQKPSTRWRIKDIKLLPSSYWQALAIITLLMLARFSELFLPLKAKEVGWSIASLPLLIAFMDVIHAGIAYPIGNLADKRSRKKLLLLGMFVFVLAHLTLMISDNISLSIIGISLLGLHMGMTQGLIKTLLIEDIPFKLRGTAFGIFNLASGIAILIANTLAGYLADIWGLSAAFAGGAIFAGSACILLMISSLKQKELVLSTPSI